MVNNTQAHSILTMLGKVCLRQIQKLYQSQIQENHIVCSARHNHTRYLTFYKECYPVRWIGKEPRETINIVNGE